MPPYVGRVFLNEWGGMVEVEREEREEEEREDNQTKEPDTDEGKRQSVSTYGRVCYGEFGLNKAQTF